MDADPMRHVTGEGLALIKRFESFSPTVYVCPAGYETIGYGHVVLDGERERFANGISEHEAEDLLRRDAGIAERAVLRLIAVPLTDGQFDALASFVFNVGAGGLQRSTLRRKVNREEHGEVPAEFMKWIWAGGRKLKGLVRRREAEARAYLAGTQ
jgi:GH24 family phage-related lysozyme (muramidase)